MLSQNPHSLYPIKYHNGHVSERLRHAKAHISSFDFSQNTVLKHSVGVDGGCLGEKGKARDGEGSGGGGQTQVGYNEACLQMS